MFVQGVTCSVNKLTLLPSLPVLECCGGEGGLERLLCIINIYHSVPNKHNPPVHPQRVGGCVGRGEAAPSLWKSHDLAPRDGSSPPMAPRDPRGWAQDGAGSSWAVGDGDGAGPVPCTPQNPPEAGGCPLQLGHIPKVQIFGIPGNCPTLCQFGGTVGLDRPLQPFV